MTAESASIQAERTALQRSDEAVNATDAHVDLERAVLPTEVSPQVAQALIIAFCAFLAVVPAVQIFLEATGRQRAQLADLFSQKPTRANLHRYEEEVARNSVFKQAVQPQVQLALSRWNGSGNTNVYIGRDRFLFYRPGMNFVSGRGIFDPARLRAKKKKLVDAGEANAQPDPRPAILQFAEDCRNAGAHLVLVPVPDKVMVVSDMVYPNGDWRSSAERGPLVNSDYALFLEEMRSAGVDVFDPMPADAASGEGPRFLKQDTHWTPEWMDSVARAAARHILAFTSLPAGGATEYRAQPTAVRRVGDLVDMLDLPANQALFPQQEVTIARTFRTDTCAPWTPEPAADVLLLGDSFANIYTAAKLGWGENAGFAPALSRHLQRPIDVIAIDGGSASLTRRELARRDAGLAGKRVVIWEFAVRELTDASWEVISGPVAPSPGPATPTPTAGSASAALEIDATIEAVSKVPQPYSVPYPDCLTFMMLHVDRVRSGKYGDARILAVMWAMKQNVWLPPAKYGVGHKLRAKLIPMREADQSVRTGQRADDIADYEHRPYFVVEESGLE